MQLSQCDMSLPRPDDADVTFLSSMHVTHRDFARAVSIYGLDLCDYRAILAKIATSNPNFKFSPKIFYVPRSNVECSKLPFSPLLVHGVASLAYK